MEAAGTAATSSGTPTTPPMLQPRPPAAAPPSKSGPPVRTSHIDVSLATTATATSNTITRDGAKPTEADILDRSIFLRMYQLKRLFRALDSRNTGVLNKTQLKQVITDMLKLSPSRLAVLDQLLESAVVPGTSDVNISAFLEAVLAKHKADPNSLDRERRRFAAPGVMDYKMQTLVTRSHDCDHGLAARRPPHVIGDVAVDPPYGVLGDEERMDLIINTYFDDRLARIQKLFSECDADHDGRLTHKQFVQAIRKLDPMTSKATLLEMIAAMDDRGNGYVLLSDIQGKFILELMKSKVNRGSVGKHGILAWPLSQNEFVTRETHIHRLRKMGYRNIPMHLAPVNTKAQQLRLNAVKESLKEVDPVRAANMKSQSNLRESSPLRSQLKSVGLIPIVPAMPKACPATRAWKSRMTVNKERPRQGQVPG